MTIETTNALYEMYHKSSRSGHVSGYELILSYNLHGILFSNHCRVVDITESSRDDYIHRVIYNLAAG